MIKISKISLQQNLIFIKLKKTGIILSNPRTFLFLFSNVHKEKMFTMELEDAP